MGGARKYVGGPGLSIPELLNEAQRASSSGHLRYAKVMWELVAENPTSTLNQLVLGTKLFMASSEVGMLQVEHLFFAAQVIFAYSQTFYPHNCRKISTKSGFYDTWPPSPPKLARRSSWSSLKPIWPTW
jgi:hypothetical protein